MEGVRNHSLLTHKEVETLAVFGDIYNVQGQIKTIDSNLELVYKGNGNYVITHKGKYFMGVEHSQLDARIVSHVRKMVYINKHGDIEADMDKNNSKAEKDHENKISNMAHDMAVNLRKPLLNKIDYGR